MMNVLKFGNESFFFFDSIPENADKDYCLSYFDREKILSNSEVETRGGRGKTILYSLYSRDLVLRHYKRGGLYGKLVEDKFFKFEKYAHRATAELNLLKEMQDQGMKVPSGIIAREIDHGAYITQDIVVERLNGYVDLSEIVAKRDLKAKEFSAIGKAIYKMFDCNIMHTDLNIRNILINDHSDVYLIDFDKCYRKDLSVADKNSILSRLFRSFKKEKDKFSAFFNENDFEILKSNALNA